jgi:hypothetical protein
MIKWIIEWSDVVFSDDEMHKLRGSLKKMPILTEDEILGKKAQYKDYIEGDLDRVLNQLTDYMREDSKRPQFCGFRANWVDDKYINVPTWLRRPDGTSTFWPLLILRKNEGVFLSYCLTLMEIGKRDIFRIFRATRNSRIFFSFRRKIMIKLRNAI